MLTWGSQWRRMRCGRGVGRCRRSPALGPGPQDSVRAYLSRPREPGKRRRAGSGGSRRSGGGARCPITPRPRGRRPGRTRGAPGTGTPRAEARDGQRTTAGQLATAEGLAALPLVPFPAVLQETRVASAQALAAWHGNFYSVPPGHADQQVTVRHRLGAATLDVVAAAGTVLARHHREPDHAGAVLVQEQGALSGLGRRAGRGRRLARRAVRRRCRHRLRRLGASGPPALITRKSEQPVGDRVWNALAPA
jgi:hypothetical protein